MKYLIAIDSDGTLRHGDGTISDTTKMVIKKVIRNGNVVVVCTARPRYHTLKIANEIEANDYIISSNGSEVYNNKDNKIIWSSYIDYDVCLNMYNYADKNNIRIMFVVDNTEYVTMYTRNDNQKLLDSENYIELLKKNVKQIMVIDSNLEKINKVKEEVVNNYNLSVVDFSSFGLEYWLSVANRDVSKGRALLELANYLNIPIKNTIAIGNDINDISMLDVSGIGVAVGNASNLVKEHANIITEDNDNDGVALFLNKLK